MPDSLRFVEDCIAVEGQPGTNVPGAGSFWCQQAGTGQPIGDGPPVPPPGQQIANPADIRTTTLRYPIETPQESPDKSEEVIDKGKRIEVNLSTDVLFELNKADLSSRAHAILVRTAEQIDDSDA